MKLSILIPSTLDRALMLSVLLNHLKGQIEKCNAGQLVEIITEVDNKQMLIGTKRNVLLNRAAGEYICFIDSDDEVADCYVEEILKAIQSGPDGVGMRGIMTTNGGNPKNWFISRELDYCTRVDAEGREYFDRFCNHLSPVRREIALQVGFPDVAFAEDYAYAKKMHDLQLVKTEVVIEKPMYHYKFVTGPKK